MNSKRIISLILSIIMTLQVFVFQTPVHAMEGVNSTTQKSEGQKIGKRSEVFEFQNTEKPKLSWFSTRSNSLFGARDVGLTRSEKVKIETTTTGLDDGDKEFNWEAFGQNKKFQAWVEVAYVGEVDKKGEPIRQRVSDVFDISQAGTIETNIVVDASKTVDNYYIVTEYDKEPYSFKINAFFETPTIKSDKKEKSITFGLGVHQIVSTKIAYNLIDEYGKEIDLNDAKEAKPADTDLKGIGKIGEDITFDLKKEGTDNLWQDQELDEWDLMDSSLALSLTKDQVTSGGIDYKLTSTYDVINGGTVTIKRQKDVVTPKDPHNPGTTPDGYARINLVADETGNGNKGTFNKDDITDTTRVVDVKAGKPYTVAKDAIEKLGKPFPLTGENKVDTGKTFKAWDPELNTLGNAVADETKTLHATYQTSKEEIIPYLPGEEVPTKDKDGLPIPTDYVNITFKSESETKGKVKIGDKEGATVLAKVKPGIDLSQKAEITTVPAQHYGFTQWKPVLGKAAEGQTYTAYFVKSGEEIGEKDPIPEGWFKVTVSQDDDSIVANTVKKAVYPVEPNGKLASDKFADLTNKAKDGYKDPAWYVGSDKVEKPYEVVINSSIDFIARAIELESHKITKDNGLKPVDFTAYKGDEMGKDFWKKGVALTTPDENLQKILDAATVTDESNRSTDKAGTHEGTLKVIFKDGSTIEVQNQKLIVIDTTVSIDYDKDAKAPRHNDEVVKGKIKTSEMVEGAKVEILDSENNVIGITLAKADGSFIAGTRKLQAGETIKVRVTLPKAGKASEPVEKTVKLNADRLNELLPIAKEQYKNFKDKENAFIKDKLDKLNTAITTADPLVDSNGKATATDTAENQTAIDNAFKALEEALKALTANIPPTISGPKTHEIFVGEDLDLKKLVDVTDGDGAGDLVVENGSNVKITAVKVEGQNQTPVTNLSNIKDNVGTYKVTYTAKDNAGAKVTHEMTLTVKPRTTSAIEVTKDPNKMSYLITEKDGKAKLDLTGMTLNLVDNLGKKTKVELTDPKVKFKVNGKEIKDGGDLKLEDDVKFIEVEYTPEGSQTPFKAQTKGVLRVGPDYDNDGTDDRTQNFDPEKIEKLEVIKQPQLDYIAKDKSEADKVFNLNLEGMIVRMTDKAGKEKLAVVSDGKFVEYDNITKEITVLTATPAHGAKLTPQTGTEDAKKGDNGKKVAITGPNNSRAETDPLKVFYDANKDGEPDYGQDQKTPAPSAMARNVGENPQGTTVEGMATPGAVIKITDKDGTVLTTEPEKVIAGSDGKYIATVKPILADGTDIKVTAKLGEMGESDQTVAKVFDDKNDNKQPDKDEGFNIAKATDIKFVDQPDLTYLVKEKTTEVTFDGKDGKGKAIYLELSYKNGEKTESKIMTLEKLMEDDVNISVTPAKVEKTTYNDQYDAEGKAKQNATLVGKNLEVKLEKADKTAKSTTAFAIEIDADGNGTADKDETTPTPSILSARNVKDGDNVETKVLVKGKPGATITIKSEDGTTDLGTGTVGTNGEVEIKLNAKQDAGKKVQAIAKLGEMKPSDPAESIVFDDLNNDGKPDGQGEVDFNNIVDMRIASDPKTMSYAVKTDSEETALKLDGLTVYVKDKNGNSGIYQYGAKPDAQNKIVFEELKGNENFKLELVDAKGENPKVIADGTTLTKANDTNKIKVSLVKNANKNDTTGPLNVFVDANGNGIDDNKEKIDLTKVNKIEVISQPELNYPITVKDNGTKKIDLTKMVVAVSDGVTTANYTAQQLLDAKVGEDKAFKLELIQGNAEAAPTTKDITSVNGIELTTANDGNKVQIALVAKTDVKTETEALQVFQDLNNDGKRDGDETDAPVNLKALNKKDDKFTTITGKANKDDVIKVYGTDGNAMTTEPTTVTAGEDGTFTVTVSNNGEALKVGTTVLVTAQAEGKNESNRTPAIVQKDADGSGTADVDETTTIKSVIARNIGTGTTSPKTKATFTTIEGVAESGSTVTITFTEKGKSEATTKTVEADKTTGEYKLELKGTTEAENILLPAETVVKASAKFGDKKDSPTIETKVFEDLDADGKADNPNENKTERPSALASNIGRTPAFTTITGEGEKGATITAKAKVNDQEVVVGTATVGSDGKYTIQATTKGNYVENGQANGTALKQGTLVSVTAKLDPKGESLPQTTHVFNDSDKKGQPDSSKDFNVKQAVKMEVVASPDKMVYNNGEKLNLNGLRVLITDVNGNQKIFKYEHNADANKIEFIKAGLSVDLKQNTVLSSKDYNPQTAKDGHNGRNLVVTLDTTGNTAATTAITGETPTALEVNKDQTAKPTDVTAANQGTDSATKVRFKAADGATIKIYKADDANKANLIVGTPVAGTGKDAGYLIATLNTKLPEGTLIEITAQETGKKESSPEQARVIRDKNSNWEGGKTIKLSAPEISPIREKDKSVTVNVPKAEDKIQTIVVEDSSGNLVTLVKDATGNTWTLKGSDPVVQVTEKDGKIEIPVDGKFTLKAGELIKVTFKDGEDPANEAFDKTVVKKASQKPIVDPVYTGEKEVKIVDPTVADPTATTIKVKVNANDSLTIEKQANGTWKIKEKPGVEVKVVDGKVVVPLDPAAKLNDKIIVTTINDSKVESDPTEVEVVDKVLTEKPTIKEATKDTNFVTGKAAKNAVVVVKVTKKDGTSSEYNGKADVDGNFKVTTDMLVDGDKVVVTASEPGKADNTSDEKTVGVDTSKLKDSIDKADKIIADDGTNFKPDDNPVDKALKEALDNGKKVKEAGDNGDPNTDQAAVDQAKENLDKAIAQKEADTAVDKAKNNPSDQNINDAQDKISQIPGTVDDNPIKKELQDKLDLIKIIKEAEEETQKDGYKDKPSADKTALENAITDGKENLKNNTKITESTKTIQEKLDIIRMERIKVGVESIAVGMKTLEIKTSVPGATVKIKINDVLIDTIETDGYGNFSKGLETALQKKQKIVLEASKLGYNDGIFRDRVY